MNRRNFARELLRLTQSFDGYKPKLLLHACCGPCSGAVLEMLADKFDVTVFWYNPNIYPKEEHDKRFDTLNDVIRLLEYRGKVKVIEAEYNENEYLEAVKGFESEPEHGKRCEKCFALRLDRCAKTAKAGDFDYFCTTLTVSRHKNADLINEIGERAAEYYGVKWLPSDFKKGGGEMRSSVISDQLGIYRQLYCGCRFSYRKDNKTEEQ